MYNPDGSNSSRQWIEIYNNDANDITLLKDTFGVNNDLAPELATDGISYKNCHGIQENITIPSKKYVLITNYKKDAFHNDYPHATNTVVYYSAISLPAKESSVRLSNDKCKHFFLNISYKNTWGGNDNGKTLEKNNIDKDANESDWHESCALGGTPGQKNSAPKDCTPDDEIIPPVSDHGDTTTDKKPDYLGQVTISEIYPAPLTAAGEKEFIEIKNISDTDIDFSRWCLKDKTENEKSTGGSCKKIDDLKNTGDFSVFYGTFSLNNDSKGDTVFLYDENKNLVDSRSYASPKSGFAYAFDGSTWRWTSLPTPEKENVFDKTLSGKITRDKTIYRDVYANFEVRVDRDAKKFTWDFGDGHKSYLQKTKHKYEKTDTYAASLKITGNGEDAFYAFDVEVKKYVAPKIRIIGLSPNPKGSDTDNEWLEIQNNSKKKINLKGWSVATGWDNLVNHPIREDFFIKAGRTKKLLQDICAFTLTNTKDKLELRDPSGKAVQKISYDHGKKSIQEETLYQKREGSNWEWSEPATAVGADLVSAPDTLSASDAASVQTGQTQGLSLQSPLDIPLSGLGKYSLDPAWQKKQNYQIELANSNSTLKIPENMNQSRVLGARIIRTQENYYSFTENIPQKHWVINFAESLWLKINSGMNWVLNVI